MGTHLSATEKSSTRAGTGEPSRGKFSRPSRAGPAGTSRRALPDSGRSRRHGRQSKPSRASPPSPLLLTRLKPTPSLRCRQSAALIPAANMRSTETRVQELICAASRARGAPRPPAPRIRSVAIGRIDENRPCEFGMDDGDGMHALRPRSKSCDVDGSPRGASRTAASLVGVVNQGAEVGDLAA